MVQNGIHAPLKSTAFGDVAASEQEAQAHQESAEASAPMRTALECARQALQNGDEKACLAAVEVAKAS